MFRIGSLFAVLLAASGCQLESPANPDGYTTTTASSMDAAGGDAAAPGAVEPANNTSSEEAAAPGDNQVTLQVGGAEQLQELLDKHQGKVVLIDFWATWCGPCVQKFPHIVELGKQHAGDGLAVITVSMDDPEEPEAVLEFLKSRGATGDNLLGKYGPGTQFAEAFEIRGDLPQYKLYDRQGLLRYQFSADPEGLENGRPIEEIDERVKELLAGT